MADSNPFAKATAVTIPAGLKWTSEAAENAKKKNTFLRVGGEKVTARLASGAPRSWSSDDPAENRTIFNVTYRITGTPENVAEALRHVGYDDGEIKAVIADSITHDNYQTTKKAEYDEELENHAISKQNKPQVACYEWDHILWFAEHLKDAKSVSKKSAPRAPDSSAAPKTKVVGAKTLKTRVENLKEGDLLDVSEMTEDFKKINVRPRPKTNKSNKHFSDPVPFMSNDLSKYKRIIEHYYGANGLTDFAANVEEVKNKLEGVKPAVQSNIPQPSSNHALKPSVAPPKTVLPQPGRSTVPVLGSPKRIGTVGGSSAPFFPAMK